MNHSMKGVNLGGWLVLEKWITPSLFRGVDARDEYGLCRELGVNKTRQILDKHRRKFITEEDFKWLSEHNIEIVRIPIGYWIFGETVPYVGGIEYLDKAFVWAKKYNLKIFLDLHGAVGSQNSQHHSGKSGKTGWGSQESIEQTLITVADITKRYKGQKSFWGIELLNEPDRKLPKKLLLDYYRQAYRLARKITGEKVAVVIPNQFYLMRWWGGLGRDYQNLFVDYHFYQIFSPIDKKLPYWWKVMKAKYWWRFVIWFVQLRRPTIVGEWSGALPSTTSGPYKNRDYVKAQHVGFSRSHANFYWTYKTESSGLWDYRQINIS